MGDFRAAMLAVHSFFVNDPCFLLVAIVLIAARCGGSDWCVSASSIPAAPFAVGHAVCGFD
jgi:hypothetical protein